MITLDRLVNVVGGYGVAARLDRAFRNFQETFPFFAAAMLACAFAGKLGSDLTVYGAWAFVIGRAAYVPLYAVGVGGGVRTIAWAVAMVGLGMTIAALFR